ncbi:hypothetical protein JST97_23435 [bacterium]|nr:hypothetical protein [bacterium]
MRTSARARRGTTLGTVILVLSVALLITLTIASASLSGKQFSQTLERRDQAHNLAEAAVAGGLASVQQNEHYGEAGAAFRDITISGSKPGSFGFLTFNQASARLQNTLCSSNFFFSNHAQSGAGGRLVPRACVHLVGTGVEGPVQQQVEALVFKPPFSEGVCCAGRIQADGVLLGGLRDPSGFTGSYAGTPSNFKMAAHVFANGRGQEAVNLQSGSDIRGNVGSAGGIRVRESDIQGEVHPYAAPRSIPRLNLSQAVSLMSRVEGNWSFHGAGRSPVAGGGDGTLSKPWSGFRVIDGPLTHSGPLVLNGGVVYVKGDVSINGPLMGKGCIVCTGSARVVGGGPMDPESNLSLCASGNVSLIGDGKHSSFFQGMVYSEGDISANDISVLGALVAPGQPMQATGNVNLKNVNVYPCPRQVSVTIGTPPQPQHLREVPPPDMFSEGHYDAMTVRVDVSEKRDGLQLYDAYLYYAKNYGTSEIPGARGWTGNAAYFTRTVPGYRPRGPETEPIPFRGLQTDELLYQLNETVATITLDSGQRTYLVDPSTLTPSHPSRPGDSLAPGQIMSTIRSKMKEVQKSGQQVLDFNLTRQLPPEEQYRILLVRDLR